MWLNDLTHLYEWCTNTTYKLIFGLKDLFRFQKSMIYLGWIVPNWNNIGELDHFTLLKKKYSYEYIPGVFEKLTPSNWKNGI